MGSLVNPTTYRVTGPWPGFCLPDWIRPDLVSDSHFGNAARQTAYLQCLHVFESMVLMLHDQSSKAEVTVPHFSVKDFQLSA